MAQKGTLNINNEMQSTLLSFETGDFEKGQGKKDSVGLGNGNPLQYYCLENPMDRGAWQATVHGIAKSQTRLSDFTFMLEIQI